MENLKTKLLDASGKISHWVQCRANIKITQQESTDIHNHRSGILQLWQVWKEKGWSLSFEGTEETATGISRKVALWWQNLRGSLKPYLAFTSLQLLVLTASVLSVAKASLYCYLLCYPSTQTTPNEILPLTPQECTLLVSREGQMKPKRNCPASSQAAKVGISSVFVSSHSLQGAWRRWPQKAELLTESSPFLSKKLSPCLLLLPPELSCCDSHGKIHSLGLILLLSLYTSEVFGDSSFP